MPAEKSSPEHQHDVVPSQFETKLRRSDVKEEQADAIVDEVNNDEQHKTRAPLNQLKQGRQEGDVILEEGYVSVYLNVVSVVKKKKVVVVVVCYYCIAFLFGILLICRISRLICFCLFICCRFGFFSL